MLISIVGKSGSGKSYISSLLSKYNSNIITLNIDEVGHNVLTNDIVKECLISSFGEKIINQNVVDRKQLGNIVFNSHKEMKKLTDITWFYMEQYIDDFIEKNKEHIIILDWLLLPKTKYFEQSDLKILVDAPLKIRMMRAIKRDNITSEKFLLREKASMSFENLNFDYVINNNQDLEKVGREVRKIYDKSIISRKF